VEIEMPTNDAIEEEADAAWQDELGQRLDSIADGTAKLIEGEQVFADLRARRRDKRDSGQSA
jgi:Putative addiction module component